MSKYKLFYRSNYNFDRAKLDEWWSLYEWRKGWFGKYNWKPVYDYFAPDGMRFPVHGDKDWAKRIAKDLKIKLPNTTKSEKGEVDG